MTGQWNSGKDQVAALERSLDMVRLSKTEAMTLLQQFATGRTRIPKPNGVPYCWLLSAFFEVRKAMQTDFTCQKVASAGSSTTLAACLLAAPSPRKQKQASPAELGKVWEQPQGRNVGNRPPRQLAT